MVIKYGQIVVNYGQIVVNYGQIVVNYGQKNCGIGPRWQLAASTCTTQIFLTRIGRCRSGRNESRCNSKNITFTEWKMH